MSEGVPVSAIDNYTPTTVEVYSHWMVTARSLEALAGDDWDAESASAKSHRWLAAERAKATAQALTDAAAFLFDELSEEFTRGQRDFVRGLLLGEAAKFEQEVQ